MSWRLSEETRGWIIVADARRGLDPVTTCVADSGRKSEYEIVLSEAALGFYVSDWLGVIIGRRCSGRGLDKYQVSM